MKCFTSSESKRCTGYYIYIPHSMISEADEEVNVREKMVCTEAASELKLELMGGYFNEAMQAVRNISKEIYFSWTSCG